MSTPIIVQPGQGQVLDLGNFEAIILASATDTSHTFTLLQTQNEPFDFGPPMHIHHDAAEAFFVLEGRYLMYIEVGTKNAHRAPSSTCRAEPRTPSR